MIEFCADAFAERAAIMEFDGGLSRFEAETLAAKAQGLTRWQAMGEMENAKRIGNPEPARDHRPAMVRDGQGALPGVLSPAAKQDGQMPVSDVQAGWNSVAMPPLWGARR